MLRSGGPWSLGLLVLLLLGSLYGSVADIPNLAGKDYIYKLHEDPQDNTSLVCFHASFIMNFTISYNVLNETSTSSILESADYSLPPKKDVVVSGTCNRTSTELLLSWSHNESVYSVYLKFSITKNWMLNKFQFTFELDDDLDLPDEFQGQLTYQTSQDNTKLFNRTFSTDQYMYCTSCMPFLFTECSPDNLTCQPCVTTYDPKENKNGTICSRVDITEMILFPGDFEKRNPTKKLCLADYIAIQELIVPVVVGGILALLLVIILVSYIIAYVWRRTRERKYERVENNF